VWQLAWQLPAQQLAVLAPEDAAHVQPDREDDLSASPAVSVALPILPLSAATPTPVFSAEALATLSASLAAAPSFWLH